MLNMEAPYYYPLPFDYLKTWEAIKTEYQVSEYCVLDWVSVRPDIATKL